MIKAESDTEIVSLSENRIELETAMERRLDNNKPTTDLDGDKTVPFDRDALSNLTIEDNERTVPFDRDELLRRQGQEIDHRTQTRIPDNPTVPMRPVRDNSQDQRDDHASRINHEYKSDEPSTLRKMMWPLAGLFVALGLIGLGLLLVFSGDDEPLGTADTTNTANETTDAIVAIVPSDEPDPTAIESDESASAERILPENIQMDVDGELPSVNKIPADKFDIAPPPGITFASDIYTIDNDGTQDGTVSLAIPDGVADPNTLDLFELTEAGWRLRPYIMQGNALETQGDFAPAFAIMDSPQGQVLFMGESTLDREIPNAYSDLFGERSIGPIKLTRSGQLNSIDEVPDEGLYYMHVSDESASENARLSLMINPEVQAAHIDLLVEQAIEKQYDGVHIDYQVISEDVRDNFTNFLTALNDALEEEGLALIVTLQYPILSAGLWDTAGQNWPEIGRIADIVVAQMPLDPLIYADDDDAEQYVAWAVSQINRRNIMLGYTTSGIDRVDGTFTAEPNAELIGRFGELAGEVQTDNVFVELDGTAEGLDWDGFAATYSFDWSTTRKDHTAWLANEAVLAYRMRLAQLYGVRGVVLSDMANEHNTLGYRQAIESVSGAAEPPEAAASAIIWTVKQDGAIVASSNSEDPTRFTWDTTDRAGTYDVTADFQVGDLSFPLGGYQADLGAGPTATPPPMSGRLLDRVNFRSGPGTTFDTQGVLIPGTRVDLIGRNNNSVWIEIEIPADDDNTESGWVSATYLRVNEGDSLETLPITE